MPVIGPEIQNRLTLALIAHPLYFAPETTDQERFAIRETILAEFARLGLDHSEFIGVNLDPYNGQAGPGFTAPVDTGPVDPVGGTGTAPDFGRILEQGSEFLTQGPQSQLGQFQGTLATDPFFQSVSPIAQRAIESQFDPLAASFALQTALSPFGSDFSIGGGGFQGPQSFQSFLGGGQAQPLTTGQFEQGFRALSPFFGEGGFTPPQQGTDAQLEALQFLSQPRIAENVISQFGQSQVAPIFQRLRAQNIQNAFSAFNLDPASVNTPGGLFGQFLRGGVGGFGGGFGV